MKSFDKVQKGDIAIVLEEKDAKVEIIDKCRCNDNGFEKMMERNPDIVLADWCVDHPRELYYDLFEEGEEHHLAELEIVLCKNEHGEYVWYEYENSDYCVIVLDWKK